MIKVPEVAQVEVAQVEVAQVEVAQVGAILQFLLKIVPQFTLLIAYHPSDLINTAADPLALQCHIYCFGSFNVFRRNLVNQDS